MEYTQNYALRKPGLNEYANVGDLNFNADKIDSQMKKNQDVNGEVYDPTSTSANAYEAGDYVINPDDGLMYRCNDTTYGTWDGTKWTRTNEFSELALAMQSGSDVTANPSGTPTATMTTVEIDGVVYDIPGSGGGGGGSAYTETTLWSGTETPSTAGTDINLSGNISDYDMIAIHVGNSNYSGSNIFIVSDLVIGETYISDVYGGDLLGAFFIYTSDTQINIKSQGSSYPQTYTKVVGISFGAGGGSGSGYSETNLYTASSTSFVDIPLTWNWTDYDAYLFFCNDVNYQTGNPWFISQEVLTSLIGSQTALTFYPYSNASVNYYVTANQLTAQSQSQGFYIRQIVGLNFGSGGGSSSGGTQYSTTEHVIGTWIDGSILYERTINLGSFSIGSGGDRTVETATNIDLLIDYDGYLVESNIMYALPDPSVRIKVETNKDLVFSGTASWNVTSGYLTIRYTKVV